MAMDFYRQLGAGVASLTFGVALSVFIFAVATGMVSGTAAWLLFAASFLLMLRFWWRYNELFVQFAPSRTFWHFLFDFLTAFFGILAVLFVADMRTWALIGILAMLSSIARCALSWKDSKTKRSLRNTMIGAAVMGILLGIVYALPATANAIHISAGIFVLVLIFVLYSARKA